MPRQKTAPSDYPQAVLRQIAQLAQNIIIARKRRGESQTQWAKKLGVSQPTMARIERGDPSVAMASYVMCIWLINPTAGLADLIAPVSDHAALEKEVARVGAKRKALKAPQKAVELSPLVEEKAIRPAARGFDPAQAAQFVASRALSATAARGFNPAKAAQYASNRAPSAKGIAALIAKTDPQKND